MRPLITERSLLNWAEKLAVEDGETFPEVPRAIGCAIIDRELSIMFIGPLRQEQPISLSEHLTTVLPIINQWEVFEYSWPLIIDQIGSIMIKTADMERWRAGHEEPGPEHGGTGQSRKQIR